MTRLARGVITAVAYLVTLCLIGSVTIFAVLVLAGPHAGLLPQPLEVIVGLAGWTVVLVVPILIARSVWGRTSRTRTPL